MEHRRNQRLSACNGIGIEYPGGRAVIGQTRDVSFRGLFVELDTADLPPHALVQLLLPIRDGELGANLRIPAAITRRTHEGIGLLYCVSYDRILKYVGTWLENIDKKEIKFDFTKIYASSAI